MVKVLIFYSIVIRVVEESDIRIECVQFIGLKFQREKMEVESADARRRKNERECVAMRKHSK